MFSEPGQACERPGAPTRPGVMVAGPHFPLEMRVLRNRAYWVFQKEQAEETAHVSVRSVP